MTYDHNGYLTDNEQLAAHWDAWRARRGSERAMDITDAERDLIAKLRQKRAAQKAYDEAMTALSEAEDQVDVAGIVRDETRAAFADAVKEIGG